MKRKFAQFLVGAALLSLPFLFAASTAHADALTISLSTAISGNGGDAITVFGNLTNNSLDTLYFSDDSLTFNSTEITGSDDIILNGFFGLGPTSIAPGTILDAVDLFTIQIAGGASPGVYPNNLFDLIGGTDPVACAAGTDGCDSDLGELNFAVTVNGAPAGTPEPATLALLALSVLFVALFANRRRAPHRA